MPKIYAVMYQGPHVGTDNIELVVAESADEAVEVMMPTANEWYEQWLDEEDYDDEGNILADGPDVWAEEYDPEEHDSKHPGGPPSESQIEELKKQLQN